MELSLLLFFWFTKRLIILISHMHTYSGFSFDSLEYRHSFLIICSLWAFYWPSYFSFIAFYWFSMTTQKLFTRGSIIETFIYWSSIFIVSPSIVVTLFCKNNYLENVFHIQIYIPKYHYQINNFIKVYLFCDYKPSVQYYIQVFIHGGRCKICQKFISNIIKHFFQSFKK